MCILWSVTDLMNYSSCNFNGTDSLEIHNYVKPNKMNMCKDLIIVSILLNLQDPKLNGAENASSSHCAPSISVVLKLGCMVKRWGIQKILMPGACPSSFWFADAPWAAGCVEAMHAVWMHSKVWETLFISLEKHHFATALVRHPGIIWDYLST